MKRWLSRVLGLELLDVDIVATLPESKGRATTKIRNASQENVDHFVAAMLRNGWEPVSFIRYHGDAPAIEPMEEPA